MNIEQLATNFAIADQLSFLEGKGGFPLIKIENSYAKAQISVYAGQVLSYQPNHAAEVLFVSENAYYQEGKAIKGGVPVCWPWFGPDPEGKGRAAHGFVRNRMWSVLATEVQEDGSTKVVLGLEDTPETREIWPYAFKLSLEVVVGKTLRLTLLTQNTGDQVFSITQALHTYFSVGDITKTAVIGLDGKQYMDNSAAGNGEIKSQDRAVIINDEVDRIYLDVPAALTIADEGLGRNIWINSAGNKAAVVWNPWIAIAEKMGDLQDDDYQRFVCVETANAADDVVEIAAGGEFRLGVEYSV